MQAQVLQIGSSRDVMIPNSVVKETSLQMDRILNLSLMNNQNILLSKKTPREGWDLAAQEMHKMGDDRLLIPDVFEDEILDDWE